MKNGNKVFAIEQSETDYKIQDSSFCKAKTKAVLSKEHKKKKRLQWCEELVKKSWRKVVFGDKSCVCIGARDNAEKIRLEKFHLNYLNFKQILLNPYIVWSCMSTKKVGEIFILFRYINF